MEMQLEIRKITAEETIPIRHSELWPEKPLDFVRIEGDENGVHLGLFIDNKLVSIISLFGQNESLRFRKFATLAPYRNKGYGAKLMDYVLAYASKKGYRRIWCDARADALRFYDRYDFQKFSEPFFKGEIPYTKIEKWLLH
jgi:GNAT superfamily N-acetyltransferase